MKNYVKRLWRVLSGLETIHEVALLTALYECVIERDKLYDENKELQIKYRNMRDEADRNLTVLLKREDEIKKLKESFRGVQLVVDDRRDKVKDLKRIIRTMKENGLNVPQDIKADAKRFRWLLDGNGYFMEELHLCGPWEPKEAEQNEARKTIDKEIKYDNPRANC